MSIDQAYNYKKVSNKVSTSGLLTKEQLSLLKSEEYEAVINLLPGDHKYAIADEKKIVEEQGIIYRQIPVEFNRPRMEDYSEFAGSMNEFENKKVMIHCAANYRVSAFYSIYAFRELGWSKKQALEWISSIWSPSEYPPWEAFISELLNSKL